MIIVLLFPIAAICRSTRHEDIIYDRPISRYRHHYGSKVNRSKKRKQDVIAFVNTVTQFIHRGSYAHIVTVVRKFS